MKIVRNSMITPDGTEIISKHRHDFVCHTDKNGKQYCIDGGHEYLRKVGDTNDCKDTSVTTDNKHEIVREVFMWNSYGKTGKGPMITKALKDLDRNHINAILKTQTHIPQEYKDLFIAELVFRADGEP